MAHVYITHSLLSNSPVKDIWADFGFFTIENKTALIIFVYSNSCICKFSFFWDNCQRVQSLGCMVIKSKFLFFFKQLPSCFPKWLGFLFCCINLCLSLTHTTVLITVAYNNSWNQTVYEQTSLYRGCQNSQDLRKTTVIFIFIIFKGHALL